MYFVIALRWSPFYLFFLGSDEECNMLYEFDQWNNMKEMVIVDDSFRRRATRGRIIDMWSIILKWNVKWNFKHNTLYLFYSLRYTCKYFLRVSLNKIKNFWNFFLWVNRKEILQSEIVGNCRYFKFLWIRRHFFYYFSL